MIDIILLIVGLTLTIVGANFLTDGSVIIARKLNVPELIIGLTIIAVGTSAPELVVSITSALKGSSEMAVGNVIGSNIFNSMMILGIVAIIKPIRLSRENRFRNIPLAIATSIVFLIMTLSIMGVKFMPVTINRLEGAILLIGYTLFILYTIKSARLEMAKKTSSNKVEPTIFEEEKEAKEKKKFISKDFLAIPMIIGGLLGLIYGGDFFLESAINIAKKIGISEYIISVTLMAGGTSLPELVACVVAARKGSSQLALGNVIGSNITNILLVLGGAAIIEPLSLAGASIIDVFMLVLSTLLLFITPYSFKKGNIDRVEGAILVLIYVGYIFWLINKV